MNGYSHTLRNSTRSSLGQLAIDKGIEGLSKKESKGYKALSKVDRSSIIGFTIGEALDKRDAGIFRQLIQELKEQQAVAPLSVLRAIGFEGARLIRRL